MEGSALWDLASELRDVLPISTLTEDEMRELVSHMHVRRFEAGEIVYHRGDPAVDAFVVHRGLVKSMLRDAEGRELLVELLGRGQFFGTLTLFAQGPRDTTVAAVVPTTVLQIGRDDGLHVLEQNKRAMYFTYERLAERIEHLAALVEGIVFLDVPRRLAKYLIEIERLDGVALTQDDIAAAIASTRETVNKTLADFEKRGLVKVERRSVRILDEERLKREIEP